MTIRSALACILLVPCFFSAAHAASTDTPDPVAQVYEVQGTAMIKDPAGGDIAKVQKGSLVGRNDIVALEKDSSIAMYFKAGGRKEIQAKGVPMTCKVAELMPKAEAYGRTVPVFGATRGKPGTTSIPAAFFYPQETVILDAAPLIEVTVLTGAGEKAAPGNATIQVLKNGIVVDSKKFSTMEYGCPYVYQPQKLESLNEYSVALKLELQQTPGNIVAISFPLYMSGVAPACPVQMYSPFSDQVYRSYESTVTEYKGAQRTITLLKQVVRRGDSPHPVIVIELFIP